MAQQRRVAHVLEAPDRHERVVIEGPVPREAPGLRVPLLGRHLGVVDVLRGQEVAIPARGRVDHDQRGVAVARPEGADRQAIRLRATRFHAGPSRAMPWRRQGSTAGPSERTAGWSMEEDGAESQIAGKI